MRKQNGTWQYRFQVNGKVYCGPTGLAATERNKTPAMRVEAEARKEVTEGREHSLKLSVQPFSDASRMFLAWARGEHRDHPSTVDRLRTSFASLGLFFGTRPVHHITSGLIDDYKSWRRTEHQVREVTLRHDLHALSKFFRYAMRHNWCRRNLVEDVEIPSDKDAVRMHLVPPAEEMIYFEAAKRRFPNLYDAGRLILLQGMRPDEVMGLPQEDVNLDKRMLLVRRGKTRAARRMLKLHTESLSILGRRIDGGKWVFPGKKAGTHLTKVNASHDKIVAETGLEFVLYDLRHTFATRMAEAGCDLSSLAAILGHSSVRMVQRYVHITQAHQDAAMARYEAFQNRQATCDETVAEPSDTGNREHTFVQ